MRGLLEFLFYLPAGVIRIQVDYKPDGSINQADIHLSDNYTYFTIDGKEWYKRLRYQFSRVGPRQSRDLSRYLLNHLFTDVKNRGVLE